MRPPARLGPALAAVALLPLAALPARACDVALLLAIDVSGSVDASEYRLQTHGLADALADPAVGDALVLARARLEVLEWSGAGQQRVAIPWTTLDTPGAVARFSAAARALRRSWDGSDTAVGEAIGVATDEFGGVGGCRRKVIDISGDGPQNAGSPLAPARGRAIAAGIAINAIAIEDPGQSSPITAFYSRLVITPKGFAVTARGHTDYPRAIRAKLLREIETPGA
ncbi:MAG: DUF1194 domain-containing protein [Paracoccaceae bacterium]